LHNKNLLAVAKLKQIYQNKVFKRIGAIGKELQKITISKTDSFVDKNFISIEYI